MHNNKNSTLSNDQVIFYRDNGYLLPGKPLFSQQKFDQLFEIFENHLANRGNLKPDELDVPHMKDERLFDFLMNEHVLDVVERLIGPNIGLWSSHFISKEPRIGGRTPWHEDSAYWEGRFDRYDDIVTIWLAIDDASVENGCMGVLPGTHRNGFSVYKDIDTDHRIFNKEIDQDSIEEDKVIWFELKRGNYSLHDSRIIHGARANTSDKRRTGYTMRYFNTDLKLNSSHPDNSNHKIFYCRGENRGNNPLIHL